MSLARSDVNAFYSSYPRRKRINAAFHRNGDSDSLFEEVPAELRYQHLSIPSGMNEMSMLKEALALANQNQNGICFLGAGSYEHHIQQQYGILHLEVSF